MGTFYRVVTLSIAVAGIMAVAGAAIAPAQIKDREKDKESKGSSDENGFTEVYKSGDGWRFRVKNVEGKPIAVGTIAFEKKDECLKAVDVVKAALIKGKVVEVKEEKK